MISTKQASLNLSLRMYNSLKHKFKPNDDYQIIWNSSDVKSLRDVLTIAYNFRDSSLILRVNRLVVNAPIYSFHDPDDRKELSMLILNLKLVLDDLNLRG